MHVVTAVEKLEGPRPWVFLAGGITNCPWWQHEVIEILQDYPHGTILNPRRHNFPIGDPNAAQEQIKWEFEALNRADIFSIWFSNADSDQPICMYELGRHLARYEAGFLKHMCVGVEPGYRREQDVIIQTKLVNPKCTIATTLHWHTIKIAGLVGTIVNDH